MNQQKRKITVRVCIWLAIVLLAAAALTMVSPVRQYIVRQQEQIAGYLESEVLHGSLRGRLEPTE